MRTKRRGVALVAACVLAGLAVGACSPGDSSSSDDEESEEAARPDFDVVDASDAETPEEAAQLWIDGEFTESTLTPEQQLEELQWFAEAAEPFRGDEINVVSETITTHEYESQVLTQAFEDITGIRVNHDLIAEGDVIEKLQTQVQ